jgi:hypothetical protein
VPIGLPQLVIDQICQQVLSQLAPPQVVPAVELDLIHAVIESRHTASRAATSLKILGNRMPDFSVKATPFLTGGGWKKVDLPSI